MSFQAVEYVLAQNIPSAPQKLVLIAIAHHVDRKTGKWTMRQEDIAKDATMSIRQVKEHIAKLDEGKRIVRDVQRAGDGSPEGTEYTLVGYPEWMAGNQESAIPAFEQAAARVPEKQTGNGAAQGAETRTYSKVRKPAPKADVNPHLGHTETRTYIKEDNPFTVLLQSDTEQQAARGPSFDAFWKAYPNKKGKALAKKRWSTLPQEQRQAAYDGIEIYLKTDDPRRGFVKHGSTYLSERVWEDFEIDPKQAAEETERKQVQAVALDIHNNEFTRACKWWEHAGQVPRKIYEAAVELIRVEQWQPVAA
jgi:hypothetical protein